MSRLKDQYNSQIKDQLRTQFSFTTDELIPKIQKIVVSVGAGEAHSNKALQEDILSNITKITGQKPVLTIAKKSVAAFKLREGNIVGAKVTLRGERMYDFLDKLISITIPRVRDFRGYPRTSFDGHGNYNLAFRDQSTFVEIPYESIRSTHGIQITIQTSAKTDQECMALLESLGFPFAKTETGA